jgi:pentatricopeptide repeat protein
VCGDVMRRLSWVCFVLVGGVAILLAADANDHRRWMDEMDHLSFDLMDAFGTKDMAKAGAAIDKMIDYQVLTEQYWAANKQDDIVKIAQDNLALGRAISAAVKAGDLDDAESKFKEMSANCTACHERRPERRLPNPRP